jgi:hypothetical protein
MPAITAPSIAPRLTFAKRRIAVLAVAALGASALLAPVTSAEQTFVHAFTARNGTTVVSGYDGGAPVAPVAKPAP